MKVKKGLHGLLPPGSPAAPPAPLPSLALPWHLLHRQQQQQYLAGQRQGAGCTVCRPLPLPLLLQQQQQQQ